MTGTIQITKPHARVLGCVPASDRHAAANAAHVQRRAEVLYNMTAESVCVHFHQLHDMGLITVEAGYCRRTPEGDRALAPETAATAPQTVSRG